MQQYHSLLEKVLNTGNIREDRTGTGTRSIFGHQTRYDLGKGFPLLTTKKLHFKSIVIELLWFLKGDTNTKFLEENGVSIWREWEDESGDLGPVYGHQWRSWETPWNYNQNIDQIEDLVHNLKTNPYSRRHVVTAWNPTVLPDKRLSPQENVKVGNQALPPCHCLFQFYVEDLSEEERKKLARDKWEHLSFHWERHSCETLDEMGIPKYKLSCQLYQRSADIFLGVPYNIASYALLTHMVAQQCEMEVGDFIHTLGDAHLYSNHVEQATEQLKRNPYKYDLCHLQIGRKPDSIFDYRFEDFTLLNYQAYPHIKAPVAI